MRTCVKKTLWHLSEEEKKPTLYILIDYYLFSHEYTTNSPL